MLNYGGKTQNIIWSCITDIFLDVRIHVIFS